MQTEIHGPDLFPILTIQSFLRTAEISVLRITDTRYRPKRNYLAQISL